MLLCVSAPRLILISWWQWLYLLARQRKQGMALALLHYILHKLTPTRYSCVAHARQQHSHHPLACALCVM